MLAYLIYHLEFSYTPCLEIELFYYQFFRSARSLSRSPVPTPGTWLSHSRGSGRTPPIISREPLLGNLGPTQSAPTLMTKNMLCVVQ